jgi:Sulfotransferase domain
MELTDKVIELIDGREVAFVLPPTSSSTPSKFCFSLPKAGSTLLYDLMQPISKIAGMAYYSLMNEAFRLGLWSDAIPASASALLKQYGYIHGGFRSIPRNITIPPWANGQSVLLVRDPRDMLVSLYFSEAYSHSPPGRILGDKLFDSFLVERASIKDRAIDDYVLEKAGLIVGQYNQVHSKLQGISCKVYKYENVIFEKENWIRDMARYFEIQLDEDKIAEIAKRFDIRRDKEELGSHIRAVTPGDHKVKLLHDTIKTLTSRLHPILVRYEYL